MLCRGAALAFGCWALLRNSVQRLSEVVVACGSEDGVEAAFVWLKPLQMAPSKGRRCRSVAGHFWRFPLNSLLHANSLLLSILPALPGIFRLPGVRICSIQSLFSSGSSLRDFGTMSPGPSAWGRQCQVL